MNDVSNIQNPSSSSNFDNNGILPAANRSSLGKEPISLTLRKASLNAVTIWKRKTTDVSNNPKHHWRAFLGEFLGTTMFIYLNLAMNLHGAVGKENPESSLLQGALTAGGALTAMIFTLGHVSGGHVNPAVTLTIVIVKALPIGIGMLYLFAQLLGSIAATGLFSLTLPSGVPTTAAMFGLVPTLANGPSLVVQLIVSALLCWVVLATGVDSSDGEPKNFLAALPIGIAVGVGVLVSGPLIGSSMNPAGSFGPILLYNHWNTCWIYLAGPLVSGLLVGVVYKFLFMKKHISHNASRGLENV